MSKKNKRTSKEITQADVTRQAQRIFKLAAKVVAPGFEPWHLYEYFKNCDRRDMRALCKALNPSYSELKINYPQLQTEHDKTADVIEQFHSIEKEAFFFIGMVVGQRIRGGDRT